MKTGPPYGLAQSTAGEESVLAHFIRTEFRVQNAAVIWRCPSLIVCNAGHAEDPILCFIREYETAVQYNACVSKSAATLKLMMDISTSVLSVRE